VTRKMLQGSGLWDRVIDAPRGGLSPEQASGTLQRMPDALHISHETIKTALYAMPRGELRRRGLKLLRRGHKSRRPRSVGTNRRSLMPGATSIEGKLGKWGQIPIKHRGRSIALCQRGRLPRNCPHRLISVSYFALCS